MAHPKKARGDLVPLGRHGLQLCRSLLEGDVDDRVAVERRHLPELAFLDEVGGLEPVARREHAVARRRDAAALDVPEDGDPGLEAGALLDLPREASPTPPSTHVAELIGLACLACDELRSPDS